MNSVTDKQYLAVVAILVVVLVNAIVYTFEGESFVL